MRYEYGNTGYLNVDDNARVISILNLRHTRAKKIAEVSRLLKRIPNLRIL